MTNKVSLTRQNFDKVVQAGADLLRRGGLIVVPFDTVYGFLCDAGNDRAVRHIFKLKDRPFSKPVGVAVANLSKMAEIAKLKPDALGFIKKKVPGPYTFILQSKSIRLSPLCQKNRTVSIRIPDSKLVLAILNVSDTIAAQTSANKSGQANTASIQEIEEQFSPRELLEVDLIVDSGKIADAAPSQIFDLSANRVERVERSQFLC